MEKEGERERRERKIEVIHIFREMARGKDRLTTGKKFIESPTP